MHVNKYTCGTDRNLQLHQHGLGLTLMALETQNANRQTVRLLETIYTLNDTVVDIQEAFGRNSSRKKTFFIEEYCFSTQRKN